MSKPSENKELKLESCLNKKCPWSRLAVKADSLTLYKGYVVGFCNPGCRNKFAKDPQKHKKAIKYFEEHIEKSKL